MYRNTDRPEERKTDWLIADGWKCRKTDRRTRQ